MTRELQGDGPFNARPVPKTLVFALIAVLTAIGLTAGLPQRAEAEREASLGAAIGLPLLGVKAALEIQEQAGGSGLVVGSRGD